MNTRFRGVIAGKVAVSDWYNIKNKRYIFYCKEKGCKL